MPLLFTSLMNNTMLTPAVQVTLDTTRVPTDYTLSNGDTTVVNTGANTDYQRFVVADKEIPPSDPSIWYWEVLTQSGDTADMLGYMGVVSEWQRADWQVFDNPLNDGSMGYRGTGQIIGVDNTVLRSDAPAYQGGEVVMIAFQPSTGAFWMGVDGTWLEDPDVVGPPEYTGFGSFWPSMQGRDIDDGGTLRSLESEFSYPVPAVAKALGEAVTPPDASGSPWVVDFTAPQTTIKSGKALRHNTASGQHALSWDTAGSSTDAEIVGLVGVETLSLDARARLIVRGGGSAGSEDACFIEATGFGDATYWLWQIDNGGFTSLKHINPPVHGKGNNRIWMRIRAEGSVVKAKVWQDGEPEPVVWQAEETTATLSAGWAGVSSRVGNTYFDAIGVGLNGASAPTTGDNLTADQLFTDFSGDATASGAPTGWTLQWESVGSDWAVVEDAPDLPPVGWQMQWDRGGSISYAGGLVITPPGGSERTLLSYEPLRNHKDVSLKTTVQAGGITGSRSRLHARCKSLAGNEEGYFVELNGGSEFRLSKYRFGAYTIIASTGFTWSANTLYNMRFEVQGDQLRASVWADGDPEPATWMLEATDTTHMAAGWCGIGAFADEAYTFTNFEAAVL